MKDAEELNAVSGEPSAGDEVAEKHDTDAKAQDSHSDWSDSALETVGGASSSSDSAKRKRKRRRGKGGAHSETAETPVSANPQQAQRARVDPELLSKSAWKIYLAEISEEGVALVGDHDARDLARRCFRLAEIFHEEQARRSGSQA